MTLVEEDDASQKWTDAEDEEAIKRTRNYQEEGNMWFDRCSRFLIGGMIGSFFCMFSPVFLSGQTLAPFVPNDPYFSYNAKDRPYFPGQWHLANNAPEEIPVYIPSAKTTVTMTNARLDANLSGAWNLGYTGKGVVIGILDDGVEGAHEDIAPNYSAKLSRTFLLGEVLKTQGPLFQGDNHGTAVAGVAAARGGNGIGGTGAAPYATVAGLRILDDKRHTDYDDFNAYLWGSGVTFNENTKKFVVKGGPEIAVKNHSYGAKKPFVEEESLVLQSLGKTAANGVIHVFSAGNDRGTSNEDANKSSANNHRDVISVAALGSDGKYSDYSSYGSSVFVTAPSSRTDDIGFGITTTDRTGKDLGYNSYSDTSNPSGDKTDTFPDYNYTSTFGGTSSSAPLVSGIMALGKEANPKMDVRMAKHALVLTSVRVDPDDASITGGWVKNGAGNRFNPNYGFGNIDAGKFVETVRKVFYVTQQTSYSTGTTVVNESIKSVASGGTNKQFTLTTTELPASLRQPLEGVEVYLNFTHSKRGDLAASITSPYATKSVFLNSTSLLGADKQDTASAANFGWTFLSNAFWGEDPLGGKNKLSGTWTVNMADTANNQSGTWNSYGVTLLMGELKLSSGGTTTQTQNIKATSMSLQNSADLFQNQAGTTLEVGEKLQVTSGELNVNGRVTMSSRPADDEDPEDGLFFLDGGIISGGGIIDAPYGFFHTAGTIKPGNSIGTLTINGDYYQEPQAKLLIEVVSPISNDLLAVNGSAALSGVLETSWGGGYIPAIRTRFGTILTASTGVSGEFSSLLTNITPTVLFKPKYDSPSQVYLMVERDYTNQTLFSFLTPNQRSVGSMLNSVGNAATGDLDTVLSKIDALPTYGQTAGVLEQLAPRGSEAQTSMGIGSASFQVGNISERLGDLRRGMQGSSINGLYFKNSAGVLLAGASPGLTGMVPSGASERFGFFVKGNTVMGDQKDTSDQPGYTFTNTGITVGSDYRFTKSFIAGLMAGINTSRANVDPMGSKVKMDGFNIGAYGTYYRKGYFVDASLSYGMANYDNTRRIVFPGLDRTATARPKGDQITTYAATGYEFRRNQWMITPTMSLQYIKLGIGSYTESGAGALNLDVDRQTIESLQGSMGGRISYFWQTAKALIMPSVRASYGHEFLRDSQNVNAQLAQGSAPFSITTPSPDRSFLTLGTGISAFTSKNTSFYAGYDAQIGENKYTAHNISAGIRMQF